MKSFLLPGGVMLLVAACLPSIFATLADDTGTVLFHQDARDAMEHLLVWGLVDVFRQHHPEGGLYSWWDYRMLGFPKNDGLRLDYILATEPVAKCCTVAEIDREERKGEKPSDHAPVMVMIMERGADAQ